MCIHTSHHVHSLGFYSSLDQLCHKLRVLGNIVGLLGILSTPNRHIGVECAFKMSCRQDKDSQYKEIEEWLR
jgi:hypothetical protein